jgi:hypothetical protein
MNPTELQIVTCLHDGDYETATKLMTPEIAKKGRLCGVYISDCMQLFQEKGNLRHLDDFEVFCRSIGYPYVLSYYKGYETRIYTCDWESYTFMLTITGCCRNTCLFVSLFSHLNLRQLDFFMDYKEIKPTLSDFEKFEVFYSGDRYESYEICLSLREIARNASIALIGIGRQRRREPGVLDAIRVIARAAWGLRLIGGDSE